MQTRSNGLLARLSDAIIEALRPNLAAIELVQGTVLAETDAPVHKVYFPNSGIISLVVELTGGEMVETAMVGADGVLNAACALDGRVSLNKAIVQVGGRALVIDVEHVARAADTYRDFRALLIHHDQLLFAQAQQSAACNASHVVEARLCRWLLRTRDLAASDNLHVTQEFLAQMLGVRRSSLSLVAGTLQSAGLIRYRRGNVHIVDVEGLRDGACECYATVKGHYERLLGPEK